MKKYPWISKDELLIVALFVRNKINIITYIAILIISCMCFFLLFMKPEHLLQVFFTKLFIFIRTLWTVTQQNILSIKKMISLYAKHFIDNIDVKFIYFMLNSEVSVSSPKITAVIKYNVNFLNFLITKNK